eukprot:3725559-Rhodomonas_salina.1
MCQYRTPHSKRVARYRQIRHHGAIKYNSTQAPYSLYAQDVEMALNSRAPDLAPARKHPRGPPAIHAPGSSIADVSTGHSIAGA